MFVIGISGPSASGKSSLSYNLISDFSSDEAFVISADNYYKDRTDIPLEKRRLINFDHPDTMDHDLMVSHIKTLREEKFVDMPVYVHANYAHNDEKVRIGGYKVLVIEGIFLFTQPKLRELMDLKIYIDTPLDLCLSRKMSRDALCRGRTIDEILDNYEKIVRPMFFKFIEPSRRYADLVVPSGGKNEIAIKTLKPRFREIIKNYEE